MTAQGSSHQRFLRALQTGSPLLALAAAHELRRLDLPDALELVLVLQAARDERYPRAALKLVRRMTQELPGFGPAGALMALACLGALDDPHAGRAACQALRALVAD